MKDTKPRLSIEDIIEPFPMKRRIPLARRYPEIASFWCYEKNCGFGPDDFSSGSGVSAWWNCVEDRRHVFQQPIKDRVNLERQSKTGRFGCPYCAGQKVCETNSLAKLFPKLAREWHPTRNGKLNPDAVTSQSEQKVWWLCAKCKVAWPAIVYNRVLHASGCPYCAGKLPSRENNLLRLVPTVAAQWHPTKNGKLKPDAVTSQSGKRVWWSCKKCKGAWYAKVSDRVANGTDCPYCAGKKPSAKNNLLSVYPNVAAQWHPTKNGSLKPEHFTSKSQKHAWWICKAAKDHVWQARIISRTALEAGCPFCAGKRVSKDNSLAARFPRIAREWHPTRNGKLRATDVTGGANRRVWWVCKQADDHVWQALVSSRTGAQTGCPYCAGTRVCRSNSLAQLFPALAMEWHPTKNGKLTPTEVTAGSNKVIWWRCKSARQHHWQASIKSRASRGYGCPSCRKNELRSRRSRPQA